MHVSRIRTGLAVGFLGLALSTGTAAAQVGGCSFSDCTPQEPEVTTTTTAPTTTTTPPEGELGTGEEVPEGELGTGEEVPEGELGTGEEVGAPGEEPTPEGVLGEELTRGEAGAAAESAPSGSLPITGGDVVALAAIGAAAVAGGTLLLKRTKQQA